MPHAIKTFENTATITTKTQLQTISVGPDVFAFKHAVDTAMSAQDGTMRAPRSKAGKLGSQGLIDAQNLEKLLKGQAWQESRVHWVLPAEGREIVRRRGRNAFGPDERRLKQLRYADVFDAFVDGRLTSEDVITADEKTHVNYTADGKVMPEAVLFEYIDSRISNRTYDLPKLIAHLMPRDDIHFFPRNNSYGSDVNVDGQARTEEQALLDIPSYNSDGGRTHTVAFFWAPSQEAYQQLIEVMIADDGMKYGRTKIYQTIFDSDALGLRACGAALCEGFYQDAPLPEDDRDFDPY